MSEIDDLYFYLFSFCRFKKNIPVFVDPTNATGVQKIHMTRDQ